MPLPTDGHDSDMSRRCRDSATAILGPDTLIGNVGRLPRFEPRETQAGRGAGPGRGGARSTGVQAAAAECLVRAVGFDERLDGLVPVSERGERHLDLRPSQ